MYCREPGGICIILLLYMYLNNIIYTRCAVCIIRRYIIIIYYIIFHDDNILPRCDLQHPDEVGFGALAQREDK